MIDASKASELIAKHGGNVTAAAKEAGIPRSTWRCKFGRTSRVKSGPVEVGLLVYDLHLPHEDQECLGIITEHVCSRYGKIDHLILGGDVCDFHRISRWEKDPFDSMPFHEEIEYSKNALEKFTGGFKVKRRKIFIKGNHEDRLQRYLWKQAPEISRLKGLTVQEQLELDRMGFEWVDNLRLKAETKRFFSIGRLNILHGHELSICPRVNPARHFFLKAMDNIIVGHVHKPDNHYAKDIADRAYGGWTVGAACDMHPTYRPQNDWKQGFAVVEWEPDGCFTVHNREIIDGVVR